MTPAKGNSLRLAAVSILVSLTVALALGEGIVRLKNADMETYDIEMWRYSNTLKKRSEDPALGHEHVPSSSAILQKVEIRTNREGLRGPELPPPRPGQRRILFLGSSITLGWGVPENQVLTSLVADRFHADGQDVVVINGGIGNYNSTRYVELFMTKLKATEPTDIVIQYFVNDAEVLDAGGGNFLLRNSELAVTLWIAFNRYFAKTGETSLIEHYRAIYDHNTAGYQAMVGALGRLADYAKAHGIRVYLAMTPDVHNLVNYKLGFIDDDMEKISARLGFTFVDFLPVLSGTPPQQIWATPGDPHPNAFGHRLMADALYPVLKAPR